MLEDLAAKAVFVLASLAGVGIVATVIAIAIT